MIGNEDKSEGLQRLVGLSPSRPAFYPTVAHQSLLFGEVPVATTIIGFNPYTPKLYETRNFRFPNSQTSRNVNV